MADTRVFVAACGDYAQADTAVSRVLDAFGGAEAILAGRKTVLVKPNLVMPKKPDGAATTHPAVVEAVCRAFVNAGARVSIIDSTIAPHSQMVLTQLYRACGMEGAAERSGAELSFDTRTQRVEREENQKLKHFNCLSPVAEAELVVTVGKVKTHGLAYFTGAVKNLFGTLPGTDKPMLHKRYPDPAEFLSAIVDICETVAPGFAILDGVVGMEGDGPTAGTPRPLGVIVGGVNPHAVDLAASRLISFRPEKIPALAEAARRGLVPRTAAELSWLGDDPAPLTVAFRPPKTERVGGFFLRHLLPTWLNKKLRRMTAKYPIISERCVGCGDCERICPQKTIVMRPGEKGRPVALVKESGCIKCYCCHEFCPARAIDFDNRRRRS